MDRYVHQQDLPNGGMIFKKKTFVESLDELDIDEEFEEAPVTEVLSEEPVAEEPELEAEIITAE